MHADKNSTSYSINIQDGLRFLWFSRFQEGFVILMSTLLTREGIGHYSNFVLLNITAISHLLVYGNISSVFLPEWIERKSKTIK